MAEHLGGPGELAVVADGQRHHGVGGAIGRIGHDARMTIAEPAAALAGDEHIRSNVDQHRQRRLIERDLDLLAFAGAMARVQRREDGIACQHPGADIHDRHAVFGGNAILFAADAHQPGLGLQNEVVARLRGLGPARAIAGDRAAHHLGRVRFEPRVAKAPFFQRAELEVVDQNVGLLDQPGENLLPRRGGQIDGQRTLVAVDAQKIGRFACRERRAPAAGVVAGTRRLDLDDIGAHVAQHHGAQRARQDAGQIDHAGSGQRTAVVIGHRATCFLRMAGGSLRFLAQPSR